MSTFFALVGCALFFVAIIKGHPWPFIYLAIIMDVGFVGFLLGDGAMGLIWLLALGIPLIGINVLAFGHLTEKK